MEEEGRGYIRDMGRGRRAFKALFGALALVVFIWLVFAGVLDAGGMNTTTTTTVKLRPEGSFKPLDRTNLNYMSKRRVPNGPDPIHNRKAGNSGQPPGA